MNKNLIVSALVALLVSGITLGLYQAKMMPERNTIQIEHVSQPTGTAAVYSLDENGNAVPLDFNETAEKVIEGVVHIKSTQLESSRPYANRQVPSPFEEFFGPGIERFFGPQESPQQRQMDPSQRPARVGTGSGVIISQDGYIVTNNHVIADADDVEVTLHDNRSYKATVVGTDPTTDLALLQINENDLKTVPFVDSDQVKIGQWVMAVGNPMGLNSTVTAGIVSAKGRNINILRDRYAVENFIQTDAAINPGNSGGALVNLDGALVGINTAIASPTGTFAGYGFAVPANMVSKVVEDLIEFGSVQRGVLGVMIRTVDNGLAKAKDLDLTQGVYVDSLMENSAAAAAGIKKGDVIVAVDGVEVKTSPELQGLIAQHRPGEEVAVTLDRDGKEKTVSIVLKSRTGKTEVAAVEARHINKALGVELEELSKDLAEDLSLDGGVKVSKLYPGKLRSNTQMKEGFIITKVDGKRIQSIKDLTKYLENKKGGVMLEGIYPGSEDVHYYAFGL